MLEQLQKDHRQLEALQSEIHSLKTVGQSTHPSTDTHNSALQSQVTSLQRTVQYMMLSIAAIVLSAVAVAAVVAADRKPRTIRLRSIVNSAG